LSPFSFLFFYGTTNKATSEAQCAALFFFLFCVVLPFLTNPIRAFLPFLFFPLRSPGGNPAARRFPLSSPSGVVAPCSNAEIQDCLFFFTATEQTVGKAPLYLFSFPPALSSSKHVFPFLFPFHDLKRRRRRGQVLHFSPPPFAPRVQPGEKQVRFFSFFPTTGGKDVDLAASLFLFFLSFVQ